MFGKSSVPQELCGRVRLYYYKEVRVHGGRGKFLTCQLVLCNQQKSFAYSKAFNAAKKKSLNNLTNQTRHTRAKKACKQSHRNRIA